MQIHQIKRGHKLKKRKRVGRGGKRGAYSGKGLKGQKARAGRKMKPVIREIIKRYPKLRGYKFNPKIKNPQIVVLNLEILDKKFNKDSKITPYILRDMGIINKIKGRMPKVKILGKGKITKPLIIEDCFISKAAREAIEKAGGTIR